MKKLGTFIIVFGITISTAILANAYVYNPIGTGTTSSSGGSVATTTINGITTSTFAFAASGGGLSVASSGFTITYSVSTSSYNLTPLASTTLNIVIPDPTSTLPYKYAGQVYFPYKFTLAQILCNEWATNVSTTVNVFRSLGINTSTIDSNIATLTCGNLTTSTVTFTTSTIPAGSVVYAAVTSTAGTANQVVVTLVGTKQ